MAGAGTRVFSLSVFSVHCSLSSSPMIPRCSRPDTERLWSDENKLDKWLRVEIGVCEALAER